MAYDGNGTFNRPVSSYVFDTVIDQDDVNTEMDGIATGLSNALCKDGQQTASANQPMGGYRHTGVGNASARTHYGVVGQIQDGDYFEVGSVSGTDTITGSVSPAITAYAQGQTFRFIAAGTNTGATTININSVGAKAIQKLQAALVAGDITSGDAVEIYYDGTQFQMLTPARTPVLANKTGVDASLVSGTAGTDGNLASWNGDGDAVDSGYTVIDDDTMATAAATNVPTAESTKAYVDGAVSGINAPTLGTPVATTSGNAANFTSIPSWVTEIVVNFAGVSTSGTGALVVQIGDSGGLKTTGYTGYGALLASNAVSGPTSGTTGFLLGPGTVAAAAWHGRMVLTHYGSNIWNMSATLIRSDNGSMGTSGGVVSLTGTLDRLSLVTADTFDAGSVNIRYS